MDSVCSICLEPIAEGKGHQLECKHTFHVDCIMKWFREGNSSSCPVCRADGESTNLSYFDVRSRCTYLRRKARNKNAPAELKRLYKKLLDSEAAEKKAIKDLKDFRKKHKELHKKYNRLRSSRWRRCSKTEELKRCLGLYNDPNYPIPIVIPRPRRRYARGRSMF